MKAKIQKTEKTIGQVTRKEYSEKPNKRQKIIQFLFKKVELMGQKYSASLSKTHCFGPFRLLFELLSSVKRYIQPLRQSTHLFSAFLTIEPLTFRISLFPLVF